MSNFWKSGIIAGVGGMAIAFGGSAFGVPAWLYLSACAIWGVFISATLNHD